MNNQTAKEVSDEDLLNVIKDFLEMGHVENIAAMFVREPRYYRWTGAILDDERFTVRLGVSVLFEDLKTRCPDQIASALPSLVPLLDSHDPLIRGEAVSVLGLIGTDEARKLVRKMTADSNPQVCEVAADILQEWETEKGDHHPNHSI